MKKTIFAVLCVIMLASMIIPVSASDEPGLVITEVLRNPLGKDTYEGFEIMNASSLTIDLYDYIIYFYCASGSTVESNAALSQEQVTTYTYLADERGKVTLAPGEIAMVWVVYAECYNQGYVKDLGNGAIEYDFDAFRAYMESDSGKKLDPSVKVLVSDKTGGQYFTTKANVAWGFNLLNSDAIRMWVCERDTCISTHCRSFRV